MSINVLVSSIALTVSIFTFYWTTLRNKKALFFVRTDTLWSFGSPQFALVNAGKNDILLAQINCHFASSDPSSYSIPPVKVIFPEGFNGVLSGGKAAAIAIEFVEPFSPEFALEGIKDEATGGRYCRQLAVELEWIDMAGLKYKAIVPHSIYGFIETGKLSSCRPILGKNELFKLAKTERNWRNWLRFST